METISRSILMFLLTSTWQTTALTLAATLCVQLTRSAPTRYRHALWVSTLALSILLPLVGFFLPLDYRASSGFAPQEITASNVISGTGFNSPIPIVRTWSDGFLNSTYRSFTFRPFIVYALTGCYFLFLSYRVICLYLAYMRTTKIRKTAYFYEPSELMISVFERCRIQLGLKNIALLCSEEVSAPVTVGALKPVIILPKPLFKVSSPDVLTSALGHEMAHIKRRDFFFNIIYELLYLPISYHPAAALLKRRIRQTREMASDEMVSGRLLDNIKYARSLVSIAGLAKSSLRPEYSLGILDANILEERIMRLTGKKHYAGAMKSRLLCAIAILLLAISGIIILVHPVNMGQANGTQSNITDSQLIGIWRGEWEEVLSTKFKSEVNSSPIRLEFKIVDDKLTGIAIHDYIGLTDMPDAAIKKLHFIKREERKLFDLKRNDGALSFKGHFGGADIEYSMEIMGEDQARLNIRKDGDFKSWLSLRREKH